MSHEMTFVDIDSAATTVPEADSVANAEMRDVVGNKSDTTSGTSLISLAKIITAKTATIPTGPLGTANIAVPTANAAGNTSIVDVIGNKLDDESGTSLFSHAYTSLAHVHSIQKVYPTLAAGITIASGAGAWALTSTFAVVVPTNGITDPFDIHAIHIGDFSANTTYELILYSGANSAEVICGSARFTRNSNSNGGSVVQFMTPLIAANSQIKCKLACAAGSAATATFSIIYHTY